MKFIFSLLFITLLIPAHATVTVNEYAVGAQQVRQTKLISYTATLSSATNATAVTKWGREGQYLIIEGKVKWTGAGGAGNFTITIPTVGSPLISTADLVGGTGVANDTVTKAGTAYWFDNGTGWRDVYPIFATTTTIGFAMADQLFSGDQAASGDALNFSVKVPIVGW